MLVYFSTPAQNKIYKDYYRKLVDRMEANSFEVFWPERNQKKKGSEKEGLRERLSSIQKAEIFALSLDGKALDSETLTEIGISYGLASQSEPKKLICALQMEGVKNIPNTEILKYLDCIAKSEYDFIDCLKSYLKTYKS